MTMLMGLFALAASVQPEGRWLPAGVSEIGRSYIDAQSVRREGDIVIVSLREDLNAPRPNGATRRIARMRYDCVARTSDVLSLTLVRPDGSVADSFEVPDDQREVRPVAPGSVDNRTLTTACTYRATR